MKVISKITVILAASLVLFGFSACANGSKSSDSPEATSDTGTNSGTENEVSNNEPAVFETSDKSQSVVFDKDGTFTIKKKNGSSDLVVGSGIYGGDPSKNSTISLTFEKKIDVNEELCVVPYGNTVVIQIINNVFTCEEKQYIRNGCTLPASEREVWYDTYYMGMKSISVKYGEHLKDDGSTCVDGFFPIKINGRFYAVAESFYYCWQDVNVITNYIEDISKDPYEATFSVTAKVGFYLNVTYGYPIAFTDVYTYFSKINPETGYWQWPTYEYSEKFDTKYKARLSQITAVENDHILNDKTAEEGYCVYKYTKYGNDHFYAIPEEYFKLEEIGPVLIKEESKNGKYEATFSIQAHPGYYIDDDHAEKLPEGVEKLLIENKNNGYWQWINESYKN